MGASWEGFALEEIIRFFQDNKEESFFWAIQADAKLDLLVFKGGKRFGFECKYTDVPKTTKSMHSAIKDLALNRLFIIYPGEQTFPLTETITACGLVPLIHNKINAI